MTQPARSHPRRAGGISPAAVFVVALTTLVGGLATLTAAAAEPVGTTWESLPGPGDDGGEATFVAPDGGADDGASRPQRSASEGRSGPAPEPRADAPPSSRADAPPVQPTRAPPPDRAAAPGETEQDAPRPTGVRIPALGVEGPTVALGTRDDGRLEVPSDAAVAGWWSGGAAPGERGPAVVAGHVDSRSGPGVFADLRRVRSGMHVLVDREDGTTAHFEVRGVLQIAKDRFPTDLVYGPTDDARLRLITCGGPFDGDARSYRDNLIVDLALIGWS